MRPTAIAVEVGGTFTDSVAMVDGKVVISKIPEPREEAYRSVVVGAALSGTLAHATDFNHASTHGLNAVLTRRPPKVAFLGTERDRDIVGEGSRRILLFVGPALATVFQTGAWDLTNAKAFLGPSFETEQPAYRVKSEGINPLRRSFNYLGPPQ